MRQHLFWLLMAALGCEGPQMREDRAILATAVESVPSGSKFGLVEVCAFVRRESRTPCVRSERCWYLSVVPGRVAAWSSHDLGGIRDHRDLLHGFAGFERRTMLLGPLESGGLSGRYTVTHMPLFRARYASLPRCR